MSVLTKVFVLLVTFLSVLLVALIVPFVAKTENWRQRHADEVAERVRAQQTARTSASELQALQSEMADRIGALNNANRTLAGQINALNIAVADAQAQLQQERVTSARAQAEANRANATAKQMADITQALNTELNERRQEMVQQQTRLIQLTDRNNELEGQLDSLTRQVRRFREQMTAMEEQNARLEQLVQRLPEGARQLAEGAVPTPGAPTETQTFVPREPIAGQITAVDRRGQTTLVEINVGRRDGVEPNMKFWVHRDGRYVGTLVITNVEADAAAGQMQIVQAEPTSGDAVLTGSF